jgi:hypothetical protein
MEIWRVRGLLDELAEKGGIAYSFEDIEVKSWSDRGSPPARRGSRRR